MPGAATNGKAFVDGRPSELVRVATAGSVDDGKSTLIGRLLYDSKQILEDQLEHVERVSTERGDGYVNLALLTDGLLSTKALPLVAAPGTRSSPRACDPPSRPPRSGRRRGSRRAR